MIVIIDYGSGNLHSTKKAFEKASRLSGQEVIVSSDPSDLYNATHIVLPGVGAFPDCMNGLKNLSGMIEALEENVLKQKKPFFGICVGMQLLASRSLEHGETKGLDWVKGDVVRIEPYNSSLKIPHMGWNELVIKQKHQILKGVEGGAHVYFVHSYKFVCDDNKNLLAETEYGGSVSAIIAKDNIIGTQFHPEKSQKIGLEIIHNFLLMG